MPHHRLLSALSKQENACASLQSTETTEMHSLSAFRKSTASTMRAFTLIELLVVIAIIAILAGLLFPAAQSALNSAKKTTAKNQIVQIATAITAYETEYGCLPTNSSGQVDSTLVLQLTTNNPRAISFIDISAWKTGKGGTNSSGAFCDPFSNTNVYNVALDTNYANQITVPTNASGATATITKHIGVWTLPKVGSTNVLINSWD
jgi:prepilin-type N-terminal cleavage/methylation domain-containing protein